MPFAHASCKMSAHLAEHCCGLPINYCCLLGPRIAEPTISWGCRRDTRFAWWLTVREQRVPKFALHLLGLPKRYCCLRLHPSLGVAEETVASISWGCRRDTVAGCGHLLGCRRDSVACYDLGLPTVREQRVPKFALNLLGLPKRYCCLHLLGLPKRCVLPVVWSPLHCFYFIFITVSFDTPPPGLVRSAVQLFCFLLCHKAYTVNKRTSARAHQAVGNLLGL